MATLACDIKDQKIFENLNVVKVNTNKNLLEEGISKEGEMGYAIDSPPIDQSRQKPKDFRIDFVGSF